MQLVGWVQCEWKVNYVLLHVHKFMFNVLVVPPHHHNQLVFLPGLLSYRWGGHLFTAACKRQEEFPLIHIPAFHRRRGAAVAGRQIPAASFTGCHFLTVSACFDATVIEIFIISAISKCAEIHPGERERISGCKRLLNQIDLLSEICHFRCGKRPK